MKTHLQVQQREDTRRDLAKEMKFVPPDLRVGEQVFYWQEDPSKISARTNIWKMVLRWRPLLSRAAMVVIKTVTSILQVNVSKLRRRLDTVDLEEAPPSEQEHLCYGFLVKTKQTSGSCSLIIPF